MIEIESVVKKFGSRVAVDALSLSVGQGEVYGFLGANGAGKTTTIRMLLGLFDPDEGKISVCGRPVRRGDRSGRMLVGAVGETQHFYPDMACIDYLAYFASLFGRRRPRERAEEVLEDVGLSDRSGDRAVDLSKGLQQKLGLARALLHDPPVLVLDEPVSGLDPHGVREVREIILRERNRGRTVFFSSHILPEVSLIADRVGVMQQGGLVFQATVKDTLARYGSLEDAFVAVTRKPRLSAVAS
jgi:ABC-2 type transport system ATP-binding protein